MRPRRLVHLTIVRRSLGAVETLKGGSGNDTLTGGAASQLIEGGAGADTIVTGGNLAGEVVNGGAHGTVSNAAAAPFSTLDRNAMSLVPANGAETETVLDRGRSLRDLTANHHRPDHRICRCSWCWFRQAGLQPRSWFGNELPRRWCVQRRDRRSDQRQHGVRWHSPVLRHAGWRQYVCLRRRRSRRYRGHGGHAGW
jgi:hypothetical protein